MRDHVLEQRHRLRIAPGLRVQIRQRDLRQRFPIAAGMRGLLQIRFRRRLLSQFELGGPCKVASGLARGQPAVLVGRLPEERIRGFARSAAVA